MCSRIMWSRLYAKLVHVAADNKNSLQLPCSSSNSVSVTQRQKYSEAALVMVSYIYKRRRNWISPGCNCRPPGVEKKDEVASEKEKQWDLLHRQLEEDPKNKKVTRKTASNLLYIYMDDSDAVHGRELHRMNFFPYGYSRWKSFSIPQSRLLKPIKLLGCHEKRRAETQKKDFAEKIEGLNE